MSNMNVANRVVCTQRKIQRNWEFNRPIIHTLSIQQTHNFLPEVKIKCEFTNLGFQKVT